MQRCEQSVQSGKILFCVPLLSSMCYLRAESWHGYWCQCRRHNVYEYISIKIADTPPCEHIFTAYCLKGI